MSCIGWLVQGDLALDRQAVLNYLLRMFGEESLQSIADGANVPSDHASFVLKILVREKILVSRVRKRCRWSQYTVYMVRNDRREELKV